MNTYGPIFLHPGDPMKIGCFGVLQVLYYCAAHCDCAGRPLTYS